MSVHGSGSFIRSETRLVSAGCDSAVAGMICDARPVGRLAVEVIVTDALPLTIDVVAPAATGAAVVVGWAAFVLPEPAVGWACWMRDDVCTHWYSSEVEPAGAALEVGDAASVELAIVAFWLAVVLEAGAMAVETGLSDDALAKGSELLPASGGRAAVAFATTLVRPPTTDVSPPTSAPSVLLLPTEALLATLPFEALAVGEGPRMAEVRPSRSPPSAVVLLAASGLLAGPVVFATLVLGVRDDVGVAEAEGARMD